MINIWGVNDPSHTAAPPPEWGHTHTLTRVPCPWMMCEPLRVAPHFQVDKHIPGMTVLETLQFAQTCQVWGGCVWNVVRPGKNDSETGVALIVYRRCVVPCYVPPTMMPLLPHPSSQTGMVPENYSFVSQIQTAVAAAAAGPSTEGATPATPASAVGTGASGLSSCSSFPLDSDEGQFLRLLDEVKSVKGIQVWSVECEGRASRSPGHSEGGYPSH